MLRTRSEGLEGEERELKEEEEELGDMFRNNKRIAFKEDSYKVGCHAVSSCLSEKTGSHDQGRGSGEPG